MNSDHREMADPVLVASMHRISAMLQAGSFCSAHAALVAIVEQNPAFVEGLRLLAGTKQALGDASDAEELLRRAVALDPNWIPSLVALGELLLDRGDADQAEPLLRRAATGAKPFPRAVLVLARHYNDRHRPAEALHVSAPLCANGNADAEIITQYIAALSSLGRVDDAVREYRRVAAECPENHIVAHSLAIALDAAQQPLEAERVAARALGRGHHAASVFLTHARSLIALGEFARAEAALRDCLARDPRLPEAHNSLARLVWMRTGDSAQSIEVLDESLLRFPGDAVLWAVKAAILQGAGDPRAAYACLAAQAARADAPPALLVRAGLAALEFEPAIAVNLAIRATQLSPNDSTALNLLAAAQLGIGDADKALALCAALLAKAPDNQYLIALQTTAWRLLGDARYARYCNYADLVKAYPLDAPAAWPDSRAFLADLKASLARLHNPQGHPLLFQSLRHGTETTEDLSRSNEPAIRALFDSFDAPLRAYLGHIGSGDDPLRRRNRGTYRFNGGWSVRLRSSGFHNSHVHPRGWISSACYIELPQVVPGSARDAGALVFAQPGIITKPALSSEFTLMPQAGTLALFPSYFWHGTVPFNSTQTRLTVAFDVVPDGQQA